MSLRAASRLLDLANVDGDGVTARLAGVFGDHGTIDTLDPDDRAACHLARTIAAGHFDGITAGRAVDLVDTLADHLGVQVRAESLRIRASEDLAGLLRDLVDDLAVRLSDLPAPRRSSALKWVARRTVGHVARIGSLPVDTFAEFAARIEHVEDLLTAPSPPSAPRTAPKAGPDTPASSGPAAPSEGAAA